MLAKDPVKRGLNRYRYCDNDPVDHADPTGEIPNIVWGALLGGGFGFGGGFLSSAVSQKMSGGEIDWWKAFGSGMNGLIVGATQGGLAAIGAESPTALFANILAGATGSAAEQGIGSGKIDPVKSIIDGLSNAVGNSRYKPDRLKKAKDAFKSGAESGAIISGLNYISDILFQKPEQRGMGIGILPGMAGAAFSPYEFLRNPRRGCGSTSPFIPSPGYSSVRGYQYELPKEGNGSQSQTKKFSLGDLLREMIIGGVTGGLSSAAFYGAGKGIERLKDGLRPSKGSNGTEESIHVYRGTDKYSEIATFKETGHLLSDATRDLYYEKGNLNDAYAQSSSIHDSWLKIWGNENDYVQAHGAFGTELSAAFGLKRTFMSVTTDSNVAQRFAGVNGRVYEAYIPKSQLIEQTLSGAGEGEYLIRFGFGGFK